MEKVSINKLYLEVTRMCNLECMHCMRGAREDKYMSLDTIDTIFENAYHINEILLTGGEPLLAIEQLKRIIYHMKKNEIKIDYINMITNGTILSKEVIEILDFFYSHSKFGLDISGDNFHLIELEKRDS